MAKKLNPKIRRQKAAELLEQAKQEEANRYKEVGELFSKTYLVDKPKPVTLEDFKAKAAKILERKTKKNPSPKEMVATAQEMVQEAEQDEAQRKQEIGDQVLKMLSKMKETKPTPGADPQAVANMAKANLSQIEALAEQIWQQ
ncbi:MAG: hypothetical protein PVH87_26220 [Desulfobacteraceae bacterium]|jgi:hypothetical protein